MYNNIEQFYYLDEQVITFIIFIQSWLIVLSNMIEWLQTEQYSDLISTVIRALCLQFVLNRGF